MMNTKGNILKLTTFGESHGECIGGIMDGFPAGVQLDFDYISKQLSRRKPGQSAITTPRSESDDVKFLSGIKDNITTGHPIGFMIPNMDKKSSDYEHLKDIFRPSHSDFTYFHKYGLREESGGGRSSARETANWVVAGALAKHLIPNIAISSFVSSVGNIVYAYDENTTILENIDSNIICCPDMSIAQKMIDRIHQAKAEGDSLGGTITCVVKNVSNGLGEPVFHKLEAELAHAMLSINACKGFEIGSGFEGTKMKGSEHNDEFLPNGKTKTNHSGGIQGGISNGMDIVFRIAMKPTSTIAMTQDTIDIHHNHTEISGTGRHDPCVLPRAVPIVDMMTSFVLADMMLWNKIRRV